jgi:hypothetical protein
MVECPLTSFEGQNVHGAIGLIRGTAIVRSFGIDGGRVF